MITCIEKNCHWTASSHDSLYWHLRRMHSGLLVFKCNFNNCDRSFSVCTVFQRHFSKHFTTHCIMDKNREKASTIEQNVTSLIMAESDKDQHFQSTINETEKQSSTTAIATEIECKCKNHKQRESQMVDIDALSNRIKAMSLNFTLKWLSADTLPRKIAFDIQQDVKSHILQPISNAIQILTNAGQVSEELKFNLLEILSVFDHESEYKCIQQLKANDLYNDPEIFTISNELRPGVSHNTQQMVSYCFV